MADLEAIREGHQPDEGAHPLGHRCVRDGDRWPCDTALWIAEADRYHEFLEPGTTAVHRTALGLPAHQEEGNG